MQSRIAKRLPENHVQAACNPSSANCPKQSAPSRFRFAAPQTVRRSRRIVRRDLRLRQCAAWPALRWRGWSGFPLPACSRFVAIRRPTRPISPCPSRLKNGMRVMGQRQHRRHAHRLAESKNQTDGSLHCFRQPKTGYLKTGNCVRIAYTLPKRATLAANLC